MEIDFSRGKKAKYDTIQNQLLFLHSDGTFQLGEGSQPALLLLLNNFWFILWTGELGSEIQLLELDL